MQLLHVITLLMVLLGTETTMADFSKGGCTDMGASYNGFLTDADWDCAYW